MYANVPVTSQQGRYASPQQYYPQRQQNQRYQPHSQYQQPQVMASQQQKPVSLGLPFQLSENQSTYLLYYSSFCQPSKELLQVLCKTPFYSKFQKFDISDGARIPPFVKSVPTAIVPGVDRPIVGPEIKSWLEGQVQRVEKETQKEIIPFHPDEMNFGFGDSYSYLDVDERSQPMEHTFAFIDRPDEKINTPAESEFGDMKKKKNAMVDSSTRPPLPQVPAIPGMQPPLPSAIPQNSNHTTQEHPDMEKAYQDLLARRSLDVPSRPENT